LEQIRSLFEPAGGGVAMKKKAVVSVVGLILVCASALVAQSPYIYGIHDHEPNPQQYLDRIEAGAPPVG
jgi:hypothetical protein